MMLLCGADHHVLAISNTIDAQAHRHTFLQLTICMDGEIAIEVAGQEIHAVGILLNSNVMHQLYGAGKTLLLLLVDSTSHMGQAFQRYMGEESYRILPLKVAELISSYAKEQYHHIKDAASYHTFLDRLLYLLDVDLTKTSTVDVRVKTLLQLLAECNEIDHALSIYADKLSLSTSRLSHLFKENIGIPLSGYIVLHKLQKAIYDILQGRTITEAAMNAGFDSPSHLANTSKKLLGMTAKDIRKDSVFLQVSSLH